MTDNRLRPDPNGWLALPMADGRALAVRAQTGGALHEGEAIRLGTADTDQHPCLLSAAIRYFLACRDPVVRLIVHPSDLNRVIAHFSDRRQAVN